MGCCSLFFCENAISLNVRNGGPKLENKHFFQKSQFIYVDVNIHFSNLKAKYVYVIIITV